MGKVSCYKTILQSYALDGCVTRGDGGRRLHGWMILTYADARGLSGFLNKAHRLPAVPKQCPCQTVGQVKMAQSEEATPKTHLANRRVIYIKIKHRCSQTRLEL